jgi:hypothetical protein
MNPDPHVLEQIVHEVVRIFPDAPGETGINIDPSMTHDELLRILQALPSGGGWQAIHAALNRPALP